MGTVTNLIDRTAYAVSDNDCPSIECHSEADDEAAKPTRSLPRDWIEDFPEEEADRFAELRRMGADGKWKLVHPNDYDMFWTIFNASEATSAPGEPE